MTKRILILTLLCSFGVAQADHNFDGGAKRSESTRWTHRTKPPDAMTRDKNATFQIGDSTKARISPSWAVDLWRGECGFRVDLASVQLPMPSFTRTVTMRNGKPRVRMGTSKVTHDMYFKFDGEGLFEWELIIPTRPDTNAFRFHIDINNLVFYHQPPLFTQVDSVKIMGEWFGPGSVDSVFIGGVFQGVKYRPRIIEHSYAVYHATKGGRNYIDTNGVLWDHKNGKAFHMPRPFAVDATGDTIWCRAIIDTANSWLDAIIPRRAWRNATYPLILDPTIGISDVGGSFYGGYADQDALSHRQTDSLHTAVAGDQVTAFHWYGYGTGNNDSTAHAVYESGATGSRHTTPDVFDGDHGNGSGDVQWWSITGLSHSLTASTEYSMATEERGNIVWYYDSGIADHTTNAGGLTDPWSQTYNFNEHYSHYATVTAGGSAPNRRRQILQRKLLGNASPLQEVFSCIISYE